MLSSTHTITGVTVAWVLGFMGVAALFGVAYVTRRREPEHLVFALMALAMAAHAWSVDVTFGGNPGHSIWRVGAYVGFISTATTATLFAHYAWLFGNSAPKNLASILYGCLLVFVLVMSTRREPFDTSHVASLGSHPLGFSVHMTKRAWALPASTLAFAIPLTGWSAVALLGRAYLRQGRRDGLTACIGGLALAIALTWDLGLLLGVVRGIWITPLGFFVFTFGVACSLIVRHAALGKELEHRTSQLEHSYEHLRATQAELVRKQQLAAVGELAAVIAHEVRNPLAIIMNATTGLHRPDLGKADERVLLDILDEEARRLNRLVGDLLRYARPIELHRQRVQLRDVIERAIHGLPRIDCLDISIEGEEQLPVSGDPELLRIVFGNLIENAAQAMDQRGKLVVRLRSAALAAPGSAIVEVIDHGHGMDPEVRRRATDPFYTTRPSGTGLGLAIVDRIVEAHGGRLLITSRPQAGTTVEVSLPIASALDEEEAAPDSAPRKARLFMLEAT